MATQQRKWSRPLSVFFVAVALVGSLLFAGAARQTATHASPVVADICLGTPGPCL